MPKDDKDDNDGGKSKTKPADYDTDSLKTFYKLLPAQLLAFEVTVYGVLDGIFKPKDNVCLGSEVYMRTVAFFAAFAIGLTFTNFRSCFPRDNEFAYKVGYRSFRVVLLLAWLFLSHQNPVACWVNYIAPPVDMQALRFSQSILLMAVAIIGTTVENNAVAQGDYYLFNCLAPKSKQGQIIDYKDKSHEEKEAPTEKTPLLKDKKKMVHDEENPDDAPGDGEKTKAAKKSKQPAVEMQARSPASPTSPASPAANVTKNEEMKAAAAPKVSRSKSLTLTLTSDDDDETDVLMKSPCAADRHGSSEDDTDDEVPQPPPQKKHCRAYLKGTMRACANYAVGPSGYCSAHLEHSQKRKLRYRNS